MISGGIELIRLNSLNIRSEIWRQSLKNNSKITINNSSSSKQHNVIFSILLCKV